MKKGDEHERKHLNLFKDKYSNYKILYQKTFQLHFCLANTF